MKSEVKEINERFKNAQIRLGSILSIIDMTLDDHIGEQAGLHPYEVFEGLSKLIGRTVHGTRIERFRPKEGSRPFHTFEIHTKEGEVLGHLNMIYLSKPIPCYYLVYIEVLLRFRGHGLGGLILKAYKNFAEDKKALALLDNIIPPEDPTYNVYAKLGWKPVEEVIGDGIVNKNEHYMVFVPASIRAPDLRCKLMKALLKVGKKRPVIDMYDNESMVKRTIEEFQSVYKTLECLFAEELSAKIYTPLMCFMFTKFVTKVLGFRRRIATLLGYTGGESLEQIHISETIRALPIQSFSLWSSKVDQIETWGDKNIVSSFPDGLKKEPSVYIEGLPVYRRPYLTSWMQKMRIGRSRNLRISDLLELGFDPTKLREYQHEGTDYIFERIAAGFLPSIERKKKFLPKFSEYTSSLRFRNCTIQINPPLAIVRDKGNVYILRRKVNGIHLDEALNQLRTSPSLKEMNRIVGIDRVIVATVNEITERLMTVFHSKFKEEIEDIVFFVSWDLENNMPEVMVDITNVSLNTIWVS